MGAMAKGLVSNFLTINLLPGNLKPHITPGRNVRVVEGARLESVYTSKGYQGFESLFLRNTLR